MSWTSFVSFFKRKARERQIEKLSEDLQSLSNKDVSQMQTGEIRQLRKKLKRSRMGEEEDNEKEEEGE